jgi:hypothetical protein
MSSTHGIHGWRYWYAQFGRRILPVGFLDDKDQMQVIFRPLWSFSETPCLLLNSVICHGSPSKSICPYHTPPLLSCARPG